MSSNTPSSSRYQKNIHFFGAFIPKLALNFFIIIFFSVIHFTLKQPWTNDHNAYLIAINKINNNEAVEELYIAIIGYFYMFMGHNYIKTFGSIILANSLLLFLINKTILSTIKKVTLIECFFICFPFLYLAFYSKEILTALLIIQLTFSSKRVLNAISFFLFAFYLRAYWWLIGAQLLIFKLLIKSKKIKTNIIYLISLISISTFILLNNTLIGSSTSRFREELNNFSSSNLIPDSVINNLNLFSNNLLNDLTNYYYSLTLIYFPFIHIKFKIGHIIFCLFQLVVVYILHFKLQPINNLLKQKAIYLVSSVIFTLVLFEPDLGSFLRHESVVFPLIAYLLILFRTEYSQNNT